MHALRSLCLFAVIHSRVRMGASVDACAGACMSVCTSACTSACACGSACACQYMFVCVRVDGVLVMHDDNGEKGHAPPTNTSGCATAGCFTQGGGSGHWVTRQEVSASGIAAAYVQGWLTTSGWAASVISFASPHVRRAHMCACGEANGTESEDSPLNLF